MTSLAQPSTPDSRSYRRDRVLKKGRIILGLHSVIDVIVRDLSATGAQLRIPIGTTLPTAFEVALVADELLFPATLRWIRGEQVGVQFTAAPRIFNQQRNIAGGW